MHVMRANEPSGLLSVLNEGQELSARLSGRPLVALLMRMCVAIQYRYCWLTSANFRTGHRTLVRLVEYAELKRSFQIVKACARGDAGGSKKTALERAIRAAMVGPHADRVGLRRAATLVARILPGRSLSLRKRMGCWVRFLRFWLTSSSFRVAWLRYGEQWAREGERLDLITAQWGDEYSHAEMCVIGRLP